MEAITQSPFGEIAALLVLAALTGFFGIILRQPLIVSFIAVGLLAGPSGLDVVHSDEQIDLLAELGIAVLLFLVGIKLDVKLIRSLGTVSLLTGLGQVAFTSIFGYFIGLALGLGHVTSLYVAVALTFSSTIIIVKLLSDKREIDALHGQIALGFLIVQDLVVVLAMIVLSAIGIGAGADGGGGAADVLLALASGVALVGLVVLFVRYVADPLMERLARAPELLGYIVIEAGSGQLADGRRWVAELSPDALFGATDLPPYHLPLGLGEPARTLFGRILFSRGGSALSVVASSAGMDGGNGGWPVLWGREPVDLEADRVGLAIDEDQLGDGERNHTSEQVGYLVIAPEM